MKRLNDLAAAAISALEMKRKGFDVKGIIVTKDSYHQYKERNPAFNGEIGIRDTLGRKSFYVLPLSKEQAERIEITLRDDIVAYSHWTLEEWKKLLE